MALLANRFNREVHLNCASLSYGSEKIEDMKKTLFITVLLQLFITAGLYAEAFSQTNKQGLLFDIDLTKGPKALPSQAKVTGGKWDKGWRTTGGAQERIVLDPGYQIKNGIFEVSFTASQLPWRELPKTPPPNSPANRTKKLNFVGLHEDAGLSQCSNSWPCPPNTHGDIYYIRTGSEDNGFSLAKAHMKATEEDKTVWETEYGMPSDWVTDDKTVMTVKLEWKNGTAIFHDVKGKQNMCQKCNGNIDNLRFAFVGSDNYSWYSPKGLRFLKLKFIDYDKAVK
jgi:hypothetical protein